MKQSCSTFYFISRGRFIMNNQKGLTLIEVIASIAILSIILLSFMKFFPQMGLLNNKNEEKQLAINEAKSQLVEWQKKQPIQDALKTNTLATLAGCNNPTETIDGILYNVCISQSGNFDVIVKIAQTSDIATEPYKLHKMEVIISKDSKELTKTYGYISYKEGTP